MFSSNANRKVKRLVKITKSSALVPIKTIYTKLCMIYTNELLLHVCTLKLTG